MVQYECPKCHHQWDTEFQKGAVAYLNEVRIQPTRRTDTFGFYNQFEGVHIDCGGRVLATILDDVLEAHL
jgi:hypothetical protein